MKIGVITIAFNEKEFIRASLKQFNGFDFFKLVLVSTMPWNGSHKMDETWALAKMNVGYGDVITGVWKDAATQYNFGLEYLQNIGIDWALILDADEFLLPEDIGRLVGDIRRTEKDCLTAPNMNVYWKTTDYMIEPRQNDNPVIAMKTDKRFNYMRRPNADVNIGSTQAELWHLSYVRTDEQMKKKIDTSNHAHEFIENWYEDKWLNWTVNSRDFHPVVPTQFHDVTYYPLPLELKELINE